MEFFSLSLLQPDFFRRDESAKSLSFFAQKMPSTVTVNLVKEMKELSSRNSACMVRVCLHPNPEEIHHDMIILASARQYIRPHRHINSETIHVMEGELGILSYHERGSLIRAQKLFSQEIIRLSGGHYHFILPITPEVLYHETKAGPWRPETDTQYAPWSPEPGEIERVQRFIDLAISELDGREDEDAAHK